jgi:hypothetical protein
MARAWRREDLNRTVLKINTLHGRLRGVRREDTVHWCHEFKFVRVGFEH